MTELEGLKKLLSAILGTFALLFKRIFVNEDLRTANLFQYWASSHIFIYDQ